MRSSYIIIESSIFNVLIRDKLWQLPCDKRDSEIGANNHEATQTQTLTTPNDQNHSLINVTQRPADVMTYQFSLSELSDKESVISFPANQTPERPFKMPKPELTPSHGNDIKSETDRRGR